MALLHTLAEIRAALETTQTIAVLGAHDDPSKAACYVPDYLHKKGYHIVPVNPTKLGKTLWGEPVRSSLAALAAETGLPPIDMVDVFRRSEDIPGHLDDILALSPLPRCVWLQLGIRNAAVARALTARGIDVVEDRCTLQDHKTLRLPPRGGPR